MSEGKISPERVDKILSFIKKTIANVTTLESLGLYCAMLEKKFPELSPLIDSLRNKENEKLDITISVLVYFVTQKGDFEFLEKLMAKIEEIDDIQDKVDAVKEFCSEEFERIYTEMFFGDTNE